MDLKAEFLEMIPWTWWHKKMETFSALLAICAVNSPGTKGSAADIFFDLRPNKRLSIQLLGWWFETASCSLWRHCNEDCVRSGKFRSGVNLTGNASFVSVTSWESVTKIWESDK